MGVLILVDVMVDFEDTGLINVIGVYSSHANAISKFQKVIAERDETNELTDEDIQKHCRELTQRYDSGTVCQGMIYHILEKRIDL